jgi:hypothetical protein
MTIIGKLITYKYGSDSTITLNESEGFNLPGTG